MTERELQEAVRRRWIRRASLIAVLGQGLAFLIGSLLPTTLDADRFGLVLGAGLVGLSGGIWFTVVPRSWFGEWRVFVAVSVAESVILLVLWMTAGIASRYFAYYLLPNVVMIITGQRRQTALLGALAMLGLVAVTIGGSRDLDTVTIRDLFAIHALQLVTFTLASVAATSAVGTVVTTISERSHALLDQARTDALTGLGNRKLLDEELPRELAAVARGAGPLSVIAIDLDGLKAVNDLSGHAAGDKVLVEFAAGLREHLRGSDRAIRSGGDEFVILLPATTREGAVQILERIRTHERGLPISFSAGIATTADIDEPSWILAVADDALYADKRRRSAPQER